MNDDRWRFEHGVGPEPRPSSSEARIAEPLPPGWTPGQLTAAVAAAIHDRDFEAVPPLVTLLALRDPDRAQQVLDTIEAGLIIGGSDA